MTDSQTYILNDGGAKQLLTNFFNGIKSRLTKKTPPIIYFHNLKYDYIGLIKKYLIIKNETMRNNQVYAVNAFFNGFEFELRDSRARNNLARTGIKKIGSKELLHYIRGASGGGPNIIDLAIVTIKTSIAWKRTCDECNNHVQQRIQQRPGSTCVVVWQREDDINK